MLQVIDFIGVPESRGTLALCAWTARLAVRSMFNTDVARRRRLASSPARQRALHTPVKPGPEEGDDLRLPEGVVSRRPQAIPEGPSPCARTKEEVFACLPSGY